MVHIVKDPLLTAATVATVLARIALVIGMIGLGATLAAAVFRPDLLASGPLIGIGSGKQDHIPTAALAIVALTIAAFALLYDFAARLAKIIATVGHGDPFTLANRRTAEPHGLAGDERTGDQHRADTDVHVPPEQRDGHAHVPHRSRGRARLFILARVFPPRRGMREELEGTV
jgi:hypothetical protein